MTEDITPFRVVAGLAVLVGLVTGLGTIVGWIVSANLGDSLLKAVEIAGAVYLVLSVFAIPFALSGEGWANTWKATLVYTGAAAALAVWAIINWPDTFLRVFGVLGIVGAILATLAITVMYASTKRKTCPDCAETVKSAARVCRYCGYRFPASDYSGPRPPRSRSLT